MKNLYFQPKLHTLGFLPQGDEGVRITVERIIEQIKESTKDPVIINTAREIIRKANARTPLQRAMAIHNFVKKNILYVKDPIGLELLRRKDGGSPARKILFSGVGDCDEHVVLVSSLYRAIGFPVALVTISTPNNPAQFSHIYVAVKVDEEWFPSDTTQLNYEFGEQYPYFIRQKVWKIDGEPPTKIEGWFEKIKDIVKGVAEKGKKILGKGYETVKEETRKEIEKIIEEQKKKFSETIKEQTQENVLWWIMVVIVILIVAWFLSRR